MQTDLSKSRIWVERENFYGDKDARNRKDTFLLIGFDTEYKTADKPYSRDEIKAGQARNRILSYQFHCKLCLNGDATGPAWHGIWYPDSASDDERMSLADFIAFVVQSGVASGKVDAVPPRAYLVGHFTRADIPAFLDFKQLTSYVSNIRNTFISLDTSLPVKVPCQVGEPVEFELTVRDTMLLTPATSKSLRALGELVGLPKITLSPDPQIERHYKQNMDLLIQDDPALFERYALNDADICLRYAVEILNLNKALFEKAEMPTTLSSIGVKLLWKRWERPPPGGTLKPEAPYEILGKELILQSVYSPRLNRYVKKRVPVYIAPVHLNVPLATECYHGGRNEQFWFGPAFEDDWTDYDLASAYPTAMGLLKKPAWSQIYQTTDLNRFEAHTLGMAFITFEFPKSVRFPTIPVRTDNGLVFPRKGHSFCASPEIALARSLGARIKVLQGVMVPYESDWPIFGDFIQDCLKRRASYPKGTLLNMFWKEISNSSYGKTAQGLRERRVFDVQSKESEALPESRITNPFYAAFITSFVRGVLSEIINGLPADVCVFSCTTDGFLSNANPDDIKGATQGRLCALYRQSRAKLTGQDALLEIKHKVRQPIGWRTRGQATLKPGNHGDPSIASVVLAKGGIRLPEYIEDTASQNDEIVRMFLNRTPDDKIVLTPQISVRDMVLFDSDLVEREVTKRLSMEFDWKRRPVAAIQAANPSHIAFSTAPWDSVEEFRFVRESLEKYLQKNPTCFKTIEDYRQFATYMVGIGSLSEDQTSHLAKKDGDIKRLRQSLGAAWKNGKGGFSGQLEDLSNAEFAELLSSVGIPCKRTDVENDRKLYFTPHRCPATTAVRAALKKLAAHVPTIEMDAFLTTEAPPVDLTKTIHANCQFIEKILPK